MIFCINPHCQQRENADDQEYCQSCGTSLLIMGRYRLIRPLQAEYKGINPVEVFEADEGGSERIMKILRQNDPMRVEMLQREALVLQLFDHSEYAGVPRVGIDGLFEFTPNGVSSPLHCLVLEKIEGQTLSEWVNQHRRISQNLMLDWLTQLTRIVNQIHGLEFFHRDIKPGNIILKADGRIVLIDFGSVGLAGEMGREGVVTGSLGYMPPEQLNGRATFQSDFFAMGRTFAHLATGVQPRELPVDEKTGQVLWRDQAPQIDSPLADLVDRLMALGLAGRPANAEVVLLILDRLPRILKRRQIVNSRPIRLAAFFFSILLVLGVVRGVFLVTAFVYLALGSEYQLSGQPKEARDLIERSLRINPDSENAHTKLAIACQSLGDDECALDSYRRALSLDPNYLPARLGLGYLYDERQDYAEAEAQYKAAIRTGSPIGVDALNNLVRIKILQREYATAVEMASSGMETAQDPITRASLFKNLGWAYLELQRYEKARKSLQESIILDPARPDAYCLLARLDEVRNQQIYRNQVVENCIKLESSLPEVQDWKGHFIEKIFQD